MKYVTFIRHGMIDGNVKSQYIGKTNQELCDKGIKQANDLYKYYNSRAGAYHYPLGTLFASPMKRCIQTAKIVFPEYEPEIVEDLREMDFGVFEGKSFRDMENDKVYRQWVDANCEPKIPEGEKLSDFSTRCTNAFLQCMEKIKDGEKACFVIHGGTIRGITSRLIPDGKGFFDTIANNCDPINYKFDGTKLIASDNSYKFFQNRDCKYFPCHKVNNIEDFNCLFCYCPLYYLGDKCGGDFKITEKGVKSCINCNRPHMRLSYDEINKKLAEDSK